MGRAYHADEETVCTRPLSPRSTPEAQMATPRNQKRGGLLPRDGDLDDQGGCRRALDATMARFLTGLNRDIHDRMELQAYGNVEKMLHKAILIEQQVKRKSYSKPAFAPKPSYQDKGKSSSTTNIAFKTDVP